MVKGKEEKIMPENLFISGQVIDEGIDGYKFYPDYLWVNNTVKVAYKCRDKIQSQVFKLIPVKIRKQTIKKWEVE
jgi:hypothetical protein